MMYTVRDNGKVIFESEDLAEARRFQLAEARRFQEQVNKGGQSVQ